MLKKLLLSFIMVLSLESNATPLQDEAISTVDPRQVLPTGTENEIYPDKPYQEYGTEGNPLREPIPFAHSPCNQQGCHYPTNRWFTDLMFYAKNRGQGGENFAVAQSPYDLSVFDDSVVLEEVPGRPFSMLPGLYLRFNLPITTVSPVEKPYEYKLNGDMYYPYLASDPTSHFMLTFPSQPDNPPKTTRKIIYHDPLTFTTEWTLHNHGGGSMTAHIVRGSPYLTMEHQALPITLRTYQNSGFFAIASDQSPPEMLREGLRITGKTFRLLLTVDDFSYGDKRKLPYPIRYYEYMLFTSSPVTLEFLKRPIGDPAFVLQSVNRENGQAEKFTGTMRIAYVGAATVDTLDLPAVQAQGLHALTTHQFASIENMLAHHANVYPIGVDLQFQGDQHQGQVKFNWKTKHMDGTPASAHDPLLMMAFAGTQQKLLSGHQHGDANYRLITLRGPMVPIIASTWTMTVPFSKELRDENLWYGSKRIPEVSKPELIAALKSDIALLNKPHENYSSPSLAIGSRNDSYGFGKQVARIARLALIADELGDQASRDLALSKIKEALSLWFPPPHPEPKDKIGLKQNYLRYDDKFGGTITARAAANPNNCLADGKKQKDQCGYNLDFYNGQYTDHHFHYGYFLYAAAVLAKFDAAWLKEYKEAVNTLARDIANPSELDAYYPTYRYFDWFEGHAFANGLVPGGDGRNQESTSEAINAWYGLTLWAKVTGKSSLAHIARIMTELEASAAQTWTQIIPGHAKSIYSEFSAYANTEKNPHNLTIHMSDWIVSGINWSLKIDHTTFFGLIKSYLIGIQLMPFTPVSNILINPEWIMAKNKKGHNQVKDAVDELLTKIQYYQDVHSAESIFKKFLTEWADYHHRYPNKAANDYWVQFAGRLNGAYQWSLNSIPAFALVDADTTYRYTAFNTNGLLFMAMQKVNEAFYQSALSKDGVITLNGASAKRKCHSQNIAYCYQVGNIEGDMGWPIAQLNYDGIDKGETITNLLWWSFVNQGPHAKKTPAALFWLDDDLKATDLSGTTATLTWQPAKIINGEGSIQYTVEVMGKTVCETTATHCLITELSAETPYLAAITARDKNKQIKSSITQQAAYITKYLSFKTLGANMDAFMQFEHPITATKKNVRTMQLTWSPALMCKSNQPTHCEENDKLLYEVKSSEEKTLCPASTQLACELTDLQPHANYTISVLAIDPSNRAQTKRLAFGFKME